MKPERYFCRYCGALTQSETRACRAHRDLLTEDFRFDRADLDETIPPLAAPVREDVSPRKGKVT